MTTPMLRRALPASFLVLAGIASLPGPAAAAPAYTTTILEYPGAIQTFPLGQNNAGTIVGYWSDKRYVQHGFMYRGGRLANFNPPGASSATPFGINDAGDVVGSYVDSLQATRGFLYTAASGTFTNVDLPGSPFTRLNGINRDGVAVGTGLDSGGAVEIFTYKLGVFSVVIDNQQNPYATAINHLGTIVGFLSPPRARENAYTYSRGIFALVPFGGDFFSAAFAVNERDETAGQFVDGNGAEYGFLYTADGKILTVQPPGSTDAFFTGINDHGVAAGATFNQAGYSKIWIYDSKTGRSATFGIAGYTGVSATGINDAGQVIGDCIDQAGIGCTVVAVRTR